jgi:EmrB/QacA subfamily drug resistance transporter
MTRDDVGRTGDVRWLALVVLCAGGLLIVLDGTVVTVALPTIQRELAFSEAGLAWVVNVYLIPFGGLLLLSGRLGDLVGRKLVCLSGLGIFTAASLMCGLANSQGTLIAARFVQGIGGALTSAVILGMIVTMFPDAKERGKAIAVYSFVQAGGASIGVIAGGVLTEGMNWHWVFWVNVPIGLLAGVLTWRLVESDRGIGLREGADVAGAVLVTTGLMLSVYTIVEVVRYGWGSAHSIGFGVLSVVLLVGFVVRQALASRPLLPLRVFRSRQLSGANVIMVLMVAGLVGFQFFSALYLQRVLGYTPVQTSLSFLPGPVLIGVISLFFAARLITRFGARPVMLTGLVLFTAALVLLAVAPVDGTYLVNVLPEMVLLGTGGGLVMPALMGLAMSTATPADSGLASGLINTTQQVGGAVGLAVLATLAASRTKELRESGTEAAQALNSGYHVAFGVGAAFLLAAIAVTVVVLREPTAVEPAPAPAPDTSSLPR